MRSRAAALVRTKQSCHATRRMPGKGAKPLRKGPRSPGLQPVDRRARTATSLTGALFQEMTMLRTLTLCLLFTGACAAMVLAHHGWGSYDASKSITVEGPITSSKFENPHALISVKASDKVWNVVLAPTTRMLESRRAGRVDCCRHVGHRCWLRLHGREGRNARRAHHHRRQDHRDALMLVGTAVSHRARAVGLAPRSGNRPGLIPVANIGHILALTLLAGSVAISGCAPARRIRRGAARRRTPGTTHGDGRPAADGPPPARCCSRQRRATWP